MGLDYEKLKKAAQELQARMNRGGGPSMRFWKPANGKNTVRILPAWTEEGVFAGQFFREVHQHWNVTEESGPVLCPKKTPEASHDKECPICDFVDQLRAQKSNVQAQELAKELRAKVAYLFSIVDLSDPEYTAKDVAEWKKDRPDSDCPFEVGDIKIQCYAAGTTVANDIMNIVIANEMDITDIESGNNVYITKIPNKNPMQTKYTVTPEIKKTKAPISSGTKLPDLSKIGKVQSYDDMVKLLGEGPAGSFKGLPANAGASSTAKAGDSSWVEGAGGGDLAAEMRNQLG